MDANHAATKFYGWTKEELKSMKISNINTLSYEQLKTEMARVVDKTRIHFEFRHRCKDGRIIDVETFSSKIDIGGKTYLHSIIHDVSEKKQLMLDLVAAKERAEENDKLKTLFLMNMSHEIRTPLNGIMGFASILADGTTDPDQTKEFSLIIQKSGQRLLSLINDIIDVSKIESGAEKLFFEEINAEGILYDATQQFEAQASGKNLALRMNIPDQFHDLVFWCDVRKLHQILTNLINNAIKFSEQGTIETGYNADDNHITFYVKDQGIGIPEEYQKLVFHRFFQAHRQDSSGNPGTGLGLTICKGLASLLGGTIRLESDPGKGTTFFLSLPLRQGNLS
jgi:PAS domain S-box-containing protein